MLLRHLIARAFSLALANAGSSSAAKMTRMPITISNSISVKAGIVRARASLTLLPLSPSIGKRFEAEVVWRLDDWQQENCKTYSPGKSHTCGKS